MITPSAPSLYPEFDSNNDNRSENLREKNDLVDSQDVTSLLVRAADFAAHSHRKQRRKDLAQTPYINHPLGVARILVDEANVFDPVVVAAAYLHDVVEDTKATFDELESRFGSVITNIVRELTDEKNSLPLQARHELQVKKAAELSHRAKLVKLADKLYNLRDAKRSLPIGS